MHHPTDRIAYNTAFVTPVVDHWLEREIAQWVHPTKDRSDDPSHDELTLLPRSYISLRSQYLTALGLEINLYLNFQFVYLFILFYFKHKFSRHCGNGANTTAYIHNIDN